MEKKHRIYTMTFASVYPLYLNKVERKGHTKSELDQIITWLTGYSDQEIFELSQSDILFEAFFDSAPHLNDNVSLIKGLICGVRVEEVQDPLMKKMRYLDKLVDELAKGKAMEKILRK